MSKVELVKARINLLKQMDTYVRETIGDDEITVNVWFACGVPDGSNETDLEEIAYDDELWLDTVKCFDRCVKLGGVN